MELISTALQMKQEKLNSNRQKLQSLRDQFGALDVMKEQDQEYLENRLQQVTDLTNQYAGGDLSDEGLSRSLQANLSQVIDDNVKNAVLSTKLFQSEQAAWNKLEKDDPDRYSEVNRAWASQNAQRWLSEDKVGSIYKGGGGIELFDDVDKRVLKELPEVLKGIKDTWVETAPGSGMYYDIVTKEAVPRHELERALDMVIGQKGARQLQINAWGANQGRDPQEIKTEYDSYQQAKVNDLDEEINKYKAAMPTASESEKQQIQFAIDRNEDLKRNISASTFDNMVASGGLEQAYTTLHTTKYKSSILDAYSYAPRIIERKVDENHKATIEFQHKLSREQEEDRRWNLKYALDVREDARSQAKFEMELDATTAANGSTPGLPAGVIEGVASEKDPQGIEKALLTEQKKEAKATQGMLDVIKDASGNTISKDLLRQINPADIDLTKKEQIFRLNGVEIKIPTDKYRFQLTEFHNRVLNNSKGKQMIQETVNSTLNSMTDVLSKTTDAFAKGKSVDMNPYELPVPRYEFVEEGGKIVRKQIKDDRHNFVILLKKRGAGKQLSEAEQVTLNTYMSDHIAADPETPELMKNEIMTNKRQNIWKNLDTKETKGLPQSAGVLMNYYDMAIKPNLQSDRSGLRTVDSGYMKVAPQVGKDFWFSELTSGDLEFEGQKVKYKGFNQVLQDNFNEGIFGAESELDKNYKLFRSNENIITPTSPAYKNIAATLGVPKGEPLTIDVKYDQSGNMTGVVEWSYSTGTGEKRKTISSSDDGSKVLTVDEVSKLTGIPYGEIDRTEYDAEINGLPVKLGSTYDVDEATAIRKQGGQLPTDNLDNVIGLANQYGLTNEVNRIMTNYYNGEYEVKLEAKNGVYNKTIVKKSDGSLVSSVPTTDSRYSLNDAMNIQKNALVNRDAIFREFVEDYVNSLVIKKKYQPTN